MLKDLETDDVWRWERLLRKREYITNCKNGLVWKIYREWIRFRFHRSSIRLGFSIPINTFTVLGLSSLGAFVYLNRKIKKQAIYLLWILYVAVVLINNKELAEGVSCLQRHALVSLLVCHLCFQY